MSGYLDLGPIGQEYIAEEEYKALYGYPNGKVNYNLAAEVPGTSRPFILENQIYSQSIPVTAPTDLGNLTQITYGQVTVNYKSSQAIPYLVYYIDATLSNSDLSQAPDGGAITWWFEGANISNALTTANQVTYNILNKGVPYNLDPNNGYLPTLIINGIPYALGNAQYPWTYNVNSGIILFTGSAIYSGSGDPNNNTPQPSANITISFWRYQGTIGVNGGDSIWEIVGNNITPKSTFTSYNIQGAQFTATSDYRLKYNISNLDSNIYNIDKLRPVLYNNNSNKRINIGLIAHELQEHFPFLVEGEKDGEIIQSVNYNGLIGVLIKEIQELKKRVKTLEEK